MSSEPISSESVDTNNHLSADLIPKHIAIIMDGNGRWAKKKGMPRLYGHRAGHTSVLKIVRHCASIGVESLTLYAFSSENWRRPEKEVKALMQLFSQAIKRNRRLFMRHDIKFNIIGDVSKFSHKLQSEIQTLIDDTKNHKSLTVNIAANYGGKWDIVESAKLIAKKVQLGELQLDDISEETIENTINLHDQAEIDLLIRTGGEQRISNFLLWQTAYSEFYFTDIFWPEFNEYELNKAITIFNHRTRRFGSV